MQARVEIFGFRVNREERKMIEALAERLQRTQSDAVRLIVREAAIGLIRGGGVGDQDAGQEVAECPA